MREDYCLAGQWAAHTKTVVISTQWKVPVSLVLKVDTMCTV